MNGAVLSDRRPFTILGDLRIVERRQDGAVNSSLGYFRFDDHILSNLQLNYTKPVCIDEFFKLKSEIAQLVYTHIDLMLFDKTKYERRSRELFDDLGLKNPEYNHMYERRRALERALKELQGIQLSSGTLRSAIIEKTRDGKDYKVGFQKGARVDLFEEQLESTTPLSRPAAVVINHYSKQTDPLASQSEELVRYFHKLFHGVDSHAPQSKETAQALSMISQHGVERSRQVVDFAHSEALKTEYQIQHFGAVLSYTSRALASLDRKPVATAQRARPLSRQSGKEGLAEEQRMRGERRLASLNAEQYQVRFQRIKARLEQEHSFLSHRATAESKIQQQMIRSRIIQELGMEPMDLMPLICLPAWNDLWRKIWTYKP
jgi:hypothetical protein